MMRKLLREILAGNTPAKAPKTRSAGINERLNTYT
jgi:hypothetical protein